ncbi:MAG: winged helix-turn-helix domain-containing protein [Candidatus Woesearchaeota archaeon]|nr:winged helix-turn-helix domain-containing protein [Candidatus Woesearchaeota archaeon]
MITITDSMVLGNTFFDALKNRCDFNEKEIAILKSLRNGDISAKKISSKSGIPLGRLYEHLNRLLEFRLIEKRGKKPCVYSIDNMDEKVRSFMKNRFDKVITDEDAILRTLSNGEEKDYIEVTRSKEEFTYSQLKMLGSCKKLYTFSRMGSMPLFMYPSNFDDFLRLRKEVSKARPTLAHSSTEMSLMVTRAYIDAYKEGKELIAVMCKDTFDFHFNLARKSLGEDFAKNMLDDLKQKMKKYKIKIYLLDENIPMQIFMNENSVYLSMIHEGATFGSVIHSTDVRNMYMSMYDGMIERSVPIEKYLKTISGKR